MQTSEPFPERLIPEALIPEALTPESLGRASTDDIKAAVLQLVREKDTQSVAKKVKFMNENLLSLFQALSQRNPAPNAAEQIPLVQGLWRSVWSTIPFQDILPGRLSAESYQIFAANGLYANMARYRPGYKWPLLSELSKWLLSYDLLILQTYEISTSGKGEEREPETGAAHGKWEIENVGIQQRLRVGPGSLDAKTAIAWFEEAASTYQKAPSQAAIDLPKAGVSRATEKRYEKVYKARPLLEHLYIDSDFRLVKSVREKNQRPSYTIATRVNTDSLKSDR